MLSPDYYIKNIYPEDGNLYIYFLSNDFTDSHFAISGIDSLGWGMTGDSLWVKTIEEEKINWPDEAEEPIDGIDFYAYRAKTREDYDRKRQELTSRKEFITEVVFLNKSLNDMTKPHNLVIGSNRWNGDWDETNSLPLNPDYEAIICVVFVDQKVDAREVTIVFLEEGDTSYYPQSEKNKS